MTKQEKIERLTEDTMIVVSFGFISLAPLFGALLELGQ